MESSGKPLIPPLAETLGRIGIVGDVNRVVPRQVTVTPVDHPDVIIIATAMGIEVDRMNGTVHVAITGGMRSKKPLKRLELKGFGDGAQVWKVVFHDQQEKSFEATVTFGPAIGLA